MLLESFCLQFYFYSLNSILNFCLLWAEYYNMPNFINLSCEHIDAACKILDSKLCLFNIIFTLQL